MTQLTDDPQANHDLFLARVQETGLVWGLMGEDGWAACESGEYEGEIVFPFWSEEADARLHCVDEWAAYVPSSIQLETFCEHWLSGMDDDGILVGTNWDAELTGLETEPLELAEALGYTADVSEEDDEDDHTDARD
jgi:hypothetical protein